MILARTEAIPESESESESTPWVRVGVGVGVTQKFIDSAALAKTTKLLFQIKSHAGKVNSFV